MHESIVLEEHLLSPQIEEVVGVGVRLETVLSILPENVEFLEGRRRITAVVGLQHGGGHRRATKDLLIIDNTGLERLSHQNILQRHFFNSTVQVGRSFQ